MIDELLKSAKGVSDEVVTNPGDIPKNAFAGTSYGGGSDTD